MNSWLLLVYRIPREPTAGRVFVWRKLKQLGAIAVQDATWVLPHSPRTQEQFQWLATEITELNGEAMVWVAEQLYAKPETLRRLFEEAADADYRRILVALKRKNPDLAKLSKRYQAAQLIDFFGSKLGRETRDALLAASEES